MANTGLQSGLCHDALPKLQIMLDLSYIRKQFPGLQSDWILMDNAGGSQMTQAAIHRINEFITSSNVQLGATYHTSHLATQRMIDTQHIMAKYINAADSGEIVMGSSTSMLIRILAMNIGKYFPAGGEIIVTNCDHEANIGALRELENLGFVIKTWKINPGSFELELDDLKKLLSDKTRLVAFTHTSNILGRINPVKEITQLAHEYGAWVCVDAVAYAPHRPIDVQDWDVDFYVYSFYKTYGPHYAMMYGKKQHLLELPGNNHYFIGQNETAYKFQPGNVNYELAWGVTGIVDYFNNLAVHHNTQNIFELIADHEEKLCKELISFLETKKSVRIIGPKSFDKAIRVPTISFVAGDIDSESIVLKTDKHKIAIRFGDFYAARLIDDLKLRQQNGVIRISMVHYNTMEETQQLIKVLDKVLGADS